MLIFPLYRTKCFNGVMFSMLASSAVDCGFNLWPDQIKDYKIDKTCLSAVFCFSEHYKYPTQYVGLVQSRFHYYFIESTCNFFLS